MSESDSKVTRELPKDGEWPCQTTPFQHSTPPRLTAFLYRLLRDGASAPGDVEQIAIDVAQHDERPTFTNPHIAAYADALAAHLLTATSDSGSGVTADNAAVMTGQELQRFLADTAELIGKDDSMEGSLAYEWGDEPGHYKVNAAVRIGNAVGQGGLRIISNHTWGPPPSAGTSSD